MCSSFYLFNRPGNVSRLWCYIMNPMNQNDMYYMQKALEMARWAEKLDEAPIGAVLVRDGKIISWGWNTRESNQQSTGHAEMMAIEKACEKLGSWRLTDCTLYVTLEPCCMCSGAIIQSRIARVVYGASDPKGGCAGSCINLFETPGFNHYPQVESGVLKEQCSRMLSSFFQKKRQEKKRRKKTDQV